MRVTKATRNKNDLIFQFDITDELKLHDKEELWTATHLWLESKKLSDTSDEGGVSWNPNGCNSKNMRFPDWSIVGAHSTKNVLTLTFKIEPALTHSFQKPLFWSSFENWLQSF